MSASLPTYNSGRRFSQQIQYDSSSTDTRYEFHKTLDNFFSFDTSFDTTDTSTVCETSSSSETEVSETETEWDTDYGMDCRRIYRIITRHNQGY